MVLLYQGEDVFEGEIIQAFYFKMWVAKHSVSLPRASLSIREACYFSAIKNGLYDWLNEFFVNFLITRFFIKSIVELEIMLFSVLCEIDF